MEDYEKKYQEGHKRSLIFGAIAMAGYLFGVATTHSFNNLIPRTEQVQQEYIAPSKLEIQCKDFDKNGEPETIIKIDGKQYALMYNKQGEPILSAYKPKAEVVQTK